MSTQQVPRKSLRERQVERTRDDIISGTRELIREEGVDRATIDRICHQAGTSRGTVYTHFPGGREEVLLAAYREEGAELVADATSLTGSVDFVERIVAIMHLAWAKAVETNLGFFLNFYGPSLLHSAEGDYRRGNLESHLVVELGTARSSGRLRDEVDVAAAASILAGALREIGAAATVEAYTPASAERTLRLILEGLAVP